MGFTTNTGGDPEPADVHAVQGQDRAARRRLPGAPRDEEGQEPAQGPAGHLRWRRQQQPLHGERNQEPGARSGRPDLCDRNLTSRCRPAGGRPRNWPGRACSPKSPSRPAGGTYPVENLNELPDIAAKIGIELRNQYVLGYSPTQSGAGREVPPGPGEAGAAARACLRCGRSGGWATMRHLNNDFFCALRR